ncbi:MAG: peptide transporter [Cyanobacteria bacterium DS2.3.42]|nr:peptide transporter [Cyanobacteria bacterium DS2.3.42]
MSDADRKSETPEENPINREVPEQTTAMAHGEGEPHHIEGGESVDEATGNYSQQYWLKNVYRGDSFPQLTVRAVLMGGILGSLMSISNLYTSIKLGWAFGVAITACVLSFVIWNSMRTVFPKLTPMTILENNCMQSTASAAGYSTGATIGTAFGAYLLITGNHVPWQILLPWTLVTALLGVFLAVPMKRQMINEEKLAFPSGIAAAETLKSLYGQSKEAVYQARSLVAALVVGVVVGFLAKAEYAWLKSSGFKLPELFPLSAKVGNIDISKFPAFGLEPSVLLIGAGMIVGMRVCATMLFGSLVLYFIVGPWILSIHEISGPEKLIRGWSIWGGTGVMVTSGLTAFALQWKTILKSFGGFGKGQSQSDLADEERIKSIEVPMKWLIIGVIPLTLAMVILEFVAFSINPLLGLFSVAVSAVLALVACRSTGETDITPIGPMGKLTQLSYAVLAPSNITTNLMAASVTSNIASSSADLLTDLKSGYLLGANARRQFVAQFIGVFFGTIAVIPAWYLMIPTKEALEKYNPPSTTMWMAVAEALSKGVTSLPETARYALVIGGVLGIVLALIDGFAPKKWKPYMPSAMGLGLSWIMAFNNSLAFFIGATIALIWSKLDKKSGELYIIPIASGAVAGEGLICALIAITDAVFALTTH